jgi:hypothetical protein
MAVLAINDLSANRALDYRAMSRIEGGGGQWVFNVARPFVPESQRLLPITNLYQITNFIADQMNIQLQNISVDNSGANAVINVTTGQNAANLIQPVVPPQP